MTTKSTSTLGKITGLFGSIRFWQLTLGAATFGIAHPDQVLNIVAGWLAAVAAVGTVDRATTK